MRDHLWDYTSLFLDCQPSPAFRIGMVGFSRPSFRRETGYVRVLKDLTTDVESLGKELFDLKTSIEKGDQYVGHALTACAHNISWSKDPGTLKLVILAGNGEVQGGGVDPRDAVTELQALGVTVHALYCVPRAWSKHEMNGWEELANKGGGTFSTFSVSTKYFTALGDFNMDRLQALNDSLNATYLYYGPAGKTRWQLMQDLDRKIRYANPEGYLHRSRFKCSPLFQGKNTAWDLVDFYQVRGETDFAAFDAALLPESLQDLAGDARRNAVVRARSDRQRYLSEMNFLLAQRKKTAAEEPDKTMPAFDVLIVKLLTDLLENNGYVCRPKKK
jgi:hypothetical protein